MVNFEAQIQDIDMALNKYDSPVISMANPDFQEVLSPRMSSCYDQEIARDSNAPLPHNGAHVNTKNACDLEGSQSCLRTWKRLACLNQNLEQTMHAQTLGKRPIEIREVEETEKASKKVQISNGDHTLLAKAAMQPCQSQ